LQEILRKFNEIQTRNGVSQKIYDSCYWSSGDYQIEMIIKTVNPENIITKKFKFSLTDQHATALKANISMVINTVPNATMNVPQIIPYTAFVEYK
jgi:hypothetical protein